MEPNTVVETKASQWSWAGFMLDPILLIGAKRYKYLWWYLLSLVPLVNIIFMVGFKIYLGLKGEELVLSSSAFANPDQAQGFLSGLNHVGKIFFWIMVAVLIIWLIIFGLVASAMGVAIIQLFSGIY